MANWFVLTALILTVIIQFVHSQPVTKKISSSTNIREERSKLIPLIFGLNRTFSIKQFYFKNKLYQLLLIYYRPDSETYFISVAYLI